MLRNVETWKGEYTLTDDRGKHYTNIVKTEKITENLFLEFGRHKGTDYHYVSLMAGDYKNPKTAHQLFFAHKIRNEWCVYDDSAIKLVETYPTKEKAVQRLREIAILLLKMKFESVIKALKEN